jgi:hypothetical protein
MQLCKLSLQPRANDVLGGEDLDGAGVVGLCLRQQGAAELIVLPVLQRASRLLVSLCAKAVQWTRQMMHHCGALRCLRCTEPLGHRVNGS